MWVHHFFLIQRWVKGLTIVEEDHIDSYKFRPKYLPKKHDDDPLEERIIAPQQGDYMYFVDFIGGSTCAG